MSSHIAAPDEPAGDGSGLGSLKGIRWLLLAGSLITSVSVFRLVQSGWHTWSLAFQFLVLVGASLALYGGGEVARRRLALPVAGGALVALFASLIPVLSWGAAHERLVATPGGFLAFAAGMAAMDLAAIRGLGRSFGYRGWLYPAALALLSAAPALLPPLVAAPALPATSAAIGAAIGLGLVFYFGSKHVNRFLFHRDRRDGREGDHPIRALPFVVLAALYAAAVFALPAMGVVAALPLAVLGAALVDVGEEYHRALAAAGGRELERWPLRSAGLLALGFSALAFAFPLALADPSHRCICLVATLAATVLLGWARHHQSRLAHGLGIGSLLAAWHFLPALAPRLAADLGLRFIVATGIGDGTTAAWAFWHVLSLPLLYALLPWLGRRGPAAAGDEPMRHLHGILTGLVATGLTGLALSDRQCAILFTPLVLLVAIAGVLLGRRIELLEATSLVFTAFLLVHAGAYLGAPILLSPAALRVLGLLTIACIALSRRLDRPLLRILELGPIASPGERQRALERLRGALLLPQLATVALLVGDGVHALCHGDASGGLQLVLGAAILFAMGTRLGHPIVVAAGVAPLTLGLHALPFRLDGDVLPLVAAVSLVTLALAWLLERSLPAGAGKTGVFRPASELAMALHAFLGVGWLVVALARGHLTVEPLVLLLLGVFLGEWGVRARRRGGLEAGLLALLVYAPLQLWATGVVASPCGVLLVSGLLLAALASLLHRVAKGLADRERAEVLTAAPAVPARVFIALALPTAIVFAGPAALALSALLVALSQLLFRPGEEAPHRRLALELLLLIPFLLQAAAALHGSARAYLLPALAAAMPGMIPTLAALGLAYTLLVDRLRARRGEPRLLAVALPAIEVMLLLLYVVAFFAQDIGMTGAQNVLALAVAIGFALRHLLRAPAAPGRGCGWWLQVWAGAAVLHGFTAGWLVLGNGLAPYAVLAAGAAELVFASALARNRSRASCAPPAELLAHVLPAVATLLSLGRTLDIAALGHATGAEVWLEVLPSFLASLFYLVLADRSADRVWPTVLSIAAFHFALLATLRALPGVGGEFQYLAPGLALIALSRLLVREMGPQWSRRVFTAGAAFVYATPMAGLSQDLGWSWLAALLVVTVAFGALSFTVRSRSLLTLSSAAMAVDLGCFALKLHQAAPVLLWLLGSLFGIALMTLGAWLEWRREGVLQQIRVFGQSLGAWS